MESCSFSDEEDIRVIAALIPDTATTTGRRIIESQRSGRDAARAIVSFRIIAIRFGVTSQKMRTIRVKTPLMIEINRVPSRCSVKSVTNTAAPIFARLFPMRIVVSRIPGVFVSVPTVRPLRPRFPDKKEILCGGSEVYAVSIAEKMAEMMRQRISRAMFPNAPSDSSMTRDYSFMSPSSLHRTNRERSSSESCGPPGGMARLSVEGSCIRVRILSGFFAAVS